MARGVRAQWQGPDEIGLNSPDTTPNCPTPAEVSGLLPAPNPAPPVPPPAPPDSERIFGSASFLTSI